MLRLIDTHAKHLDIFTQGADTTLLVLDIDTGKCVYQVRVVNLEEGWLERLVDEVPDNNLLDDWPIERVYGNFKIMRIADVE